MSVKVKNNFISITKKEYLPIKWNVLALLFVLFSPIYTFSQRIGYSAFYVSERGNLPIGFASAHLDYLLKKKSNYELVGGLQFIGAATGVRGGYFAFGYRMEGLTNTNKKLNFGSSIGFLAGGGGAAPDKDGWMIQGSVFAQTKIARSINFRAGINYSHVSGDMIRGFSPTIGIYSDFKLNKDTIKSDSELKWTAVYPEIGFGLSNKLKLIFIGTSASWQFKKIAGDISIHALANLYGGYMQALLNTGYNFGNNRLKFIPSLITGIAGGGGTTIGGGAIFGVQSYLGFQGNSTSVGLKYQYVKSISTSFYYQGLFFSVGKSINNSSKFSLNWYPVLKAYSGSNGFGNLGIRIVALKNKRFNLMGSSYWAFTHNKGAYAEGLFETTYKPFESLPMYTLISVGAGAGAGINGKKESVIAGLGFGIDSPWINLPISIELQAWKGGNIPSYSLSMIYQF